MYHDVPMKVHAVYWDVLHNTSLVTQCMFTHRQSVVYTAELLLHNIVNFTNAKHTYKKRSIGLLVWVHWDPDWDASV